jgi:cation diffusion facilitator CzcD-associated flavoprotein CzcO
MLMDINAPVPLAGPALTPTAFRAAILVASPSKSAAAAALAAACEHLQPALARRASTIDIIGLDMTQPPAAQAAQTAAALAWAVDAPIALVAVGNGAADVAAQTGALLAADKSVSRRATRVFDALALGGASSPEGAADEIAREMAQVRGSAGFDKRRLVMGRNPAPLPEQTEVVVVGAGLLGLVAAARLKAAGRSVLILEKRSVVAGIWSLFANSHSQVNSSEGGYCLKDLLPPAARAKAAQNRDHSTAAEILEDAAALAHSLKECIYTEVGVVRVLGKDGAYQVIAEESNPVGGTGCTRIIAAAGVVLAINDRVGLPRPLACPGMAAFKEAGGSVADGTADALNHVHWQGKKVAIFGCGAFAIENVRTALEAGAAHVTVVARRLGTICPKVRVRDRVRVRGPLTLTLTLTSTLTRTSPKVIDYLNFVKPWDAAYRHDTGTNVKQLQAWRKLYKESTATAPSCWPAKIKHDGHTISVSDVWFIGHHLGKMSTVVGQLDHLEEGRVHLSDGTTLEADVVVGCIGFERNTTFCEQLTGRTVVRHSNYLDKNMMYLADAEIDESAFNSFFGQG